MAQYNSNYTGAQIDSGIQKANNPDTIVTSGSSNLITSGAVYTVCGNIETLLAAI